MKKRKSPLKIGKETYGELDPKEAFTKALAPYFVPKDQKQDTTATNAMRLTGTG